MENAESANHRPSPDDEKNNIMVGDERREKERDGARPHPTEARLSSNKGQFESERRGELGVGKRSKEQQPF